MWRKSSGETRKNVASKAKSQAAASDRLSKNTSHDPPARKKKIKSRSQSNPRERASSRDEDSPPDSGLDRCAVLLANILDEESADTGLGQSRSPNTANFQSKRTPRSEEKLKLKGCYNHSMEQDKQVVVVPTALNGHHHDSNGEDFQSNHQTLNISSRSADGSDEIMDSLATSTPRKDTIRTVNNELSEEITSSRPDYEVEVASTSDQETNIASKSVEYSRKAGRNNGASGETPEDDGDASSTVLLLKSLNSNKHKTLDEKLNMISTAGDIAKSNARASSSDDGTRVLKQTLEKLSAQKERVERLRSQQNSRMSSHVENNSLDRDNVRKKGDNAKPRRSNSKDRNGLSNSFDANSIRQRKVSAMNDHLGIVNDLFYDLRTTVSRRRDSELLTIVQELEDAVSLLPSIVDKKILDNELKLSVDPLKEQLKAVQAELESCKQKLHEKEYELNKLDDSKRNELTAVKQNLGQQLAQEKLNFNKLKSTMFNTTAERDKLLKENESLRAQMTEQSRKMRECSNNFGHELRDIRMEISTAMNEVQTQKDKLAKAERENEELRWAVESRDEEVKTLTDLVSKQQSSMNEMQRDLSYARSSLDQQTKLADTFAAEVSALQKKLEELEDFKRKADQKGKEAEKNVASSNSNLHFAYSIHHENSNPSQPSYESISYDSDGVLRNASLVPTSGVPTLYTSGSYNSGSAIGSKPSWITTSASGTFPRNPTPHVAPTVTSNPHIDSIDPSIMSQIASLNKPQQAKTVASSVGSENTHSSNNQSWSHHIDAKSALLTYTEHSVQSQSHLKTAWAPASTYQIPSSYSGVNGFSHERAPQVTSSYHPNTSKASVPSSKSLPVSSTSTSDHHSAAEHHRNASDSKPAKDNPIDYYNYIPYIPKAPYSFTTDLYGNPICQAPANPTVTSTVSAPVQHEKPVYNFNYSSYPPKLTFPSETGGHSSFGFSPLEPIEDEISPSMSGASHSEVRKNYQTRFEGSNRGKGDSGFYESHGKTYNGTANGLDDSLFDLLSEQEDNNHVTTHKHGQDYYYSHERSPGSVPVLDFSTLSITSSAPQSARSESKFQEGVKSLDADIQKLQNSIHHLFSSDKAAAAT